MPQDTRRAPHPSLVSPVNVIVVCAIALAFLGLTILFSASAWFIDKRGVAVPYAYLTKQVAGVVVAAGLCYLFSRLNLEEVRRYAWWIGGISLFLLALVLIPHIGIRVNGSRRWLGVGAMRFQVSEFAKLGLVFCLAHYLALNQSRIGEFKRGFLWPLLGIGAFGGLVLLETDMGSAALMIAVGLLLLFHAGARWSFILPSLAGVAAVFATTLLLIPNRLERFTAFLDVEGNKTGRTYQLYQALAAFASGGTEGAGLGRGRQQLNYLPEAHTDFIFSVVGEELGLWFTLAVVAVFTVIFIAGLLHLRRAPNLFQFLLVLGCLLLICLQAIINLGVVTGLLPTKGMSLPFISAGLSNLLLMGMLLGILLNTQRTWGRAALSRNAGSMREVLA
ncbi:MAG: cell division protein FtsW [Verrucomicrobia bacterium]|nr:cell division protein FtsW [Verrucomicrobiota bacterium]